MGLFVQKHNNNYAANKNNINPFNNYNNQSYGNNIDWAQFLVLGIPNVSIFALQALDSNLESDGRGGKAKSNTVEDSETDAQIEAKQAELKNICSKNSVDNTKALEKKTEKANKELEEKVIDVKDIQNKISSIDTEIAQYTTDLENLQSQLNYALDHKDDASLYDSKEINRLEQKINMVKSDIETLNSQKNELENKDLKNAKEVLTNAQNEVAVLYTDLGNAQNIEQEIRQLQGKKLSKEANYDVEQESQDINKFMNCLKEFKTNPTKQNAENLKKAYDGDGSDKKNRVQQKSVQKAYSMVSEQVEKLLSQAV